MTKRNLEGDFKFLWGKLCPNIPLVPELQFAKDLGRKWRFDFADPSHMVAIELEGGTWSNGRHTRGSGYEKDCEKYNTATLMGWKIFRLTKIEPEWLETIRDFITNNSKYEGN